LTTWNVLNATPLPSGTSQKPTILHFPGALENAIKPNALNSELASYGYTVVALDHPGEPQFLQPPDVEGTYSLDPADYTPAVLSGLYKMRVEDSLAMTSRLFPAFVKTISAPFNTTHYLALGYSLGGAVAAGSIAADPSMLAAVSVDGLFIETPDVKKPFLMIGGTEHTPEIDATWSPFSKNQSGWYR
jgi:alpha-beta hydrolase superfamily lysophospholipase